MKIKWISRYRKAQCKPDPAFPKGKDIDTGMRPACRVDLPYPAQCVGMHYVECEECGTNCLITAAGRPDDPKSLMLPCEGKGGIVIQ
jgi:hypothetical protein